MAPAHNVIVICVFNSASGKPLADQQSPLALAPAMAAPAKYGAC